MKTEIVIIGGGVVGASIAYHLTERGCSDVLVLDRERALGLGSTGRATGGVRAQFETDINIRLSLYSIDFIREWEADTGYEPEGYLFLATNNLHLEYLSRNVDRQQELGYADVHLLTQDEIADKVPGLNVSDVVGGSFGPRDGFINPLAMLEEFIVGASKRGARIVTGVEVRKIVVESGRVRRVITKDGVVDCERVIVAAGAWAAGVAASVGIRLPVEPQRRQTIWAEAPEPLPADLPMVVDMNDGFHFKPARDFTHAAPAVDPRAILFAWPDPDEPPSFSTKFDEEFLLKVGVRAFDRAPFLAGSRIVHEKCRAGLYENTPDHHAILGGCDIEGLYFACGFSGHGVMHSPATGRALAEIVLDGEASFMDVSSLSLDRFAKGELLHETAFI